MPLDEAYQSQTDAVLLDMAQRPQAPKKQEPSFSLWATMTAAPKGVAAGAAEATGSTADILGAFGQVMAATDARPGGMFSTEERKLSDVITGSSESERARQKMLNGVDFNSESGRLFRDVGKSYMPDPVTSHGAEQVVANLFRVGGKAIGSAAALGPVPGAILAGAEEGFTTSDELGQKGVDLGTRSAVGAVTGAVNALGFALPVAGQTVKGTVGLALAGGPASFIAQNEASREILKRADYSQLSEQYDPFDPVGLALSSLLPIGFGALAMRGGRAKARVDADAVDAARVGLLRENVDMARPTLPEDLAGAVAHETSVARAIDQMSAGERVDVTDVAPARTAEIISETVAERLKPLARAFEEEVKLREPARVAEADSVIAATEAPPAATKPAAPETNAAAGETGAFKSESPELDRASADIEARMPDMMVHLDGMAEPMKLSELMARTRDEAKADASESHLIEAAANCFLRTGS